MSLRLSLKSRLQTNISMIKIIYEKPVHFIRFNVLVPILKIFQVAVQNDVALADVIASSSGLSTVALSIFVLGAFVLVAFVLVASVVSTSLLATFVLAIFSLVAFVQVPRKF